MIVGCSSVTLSFMLIFKDNIMIKFNKILNYVLNLIKITGKTVEQL